MDLNVVRVKRKATDDPAEALVIAIKKPKCDERKETVFLKLAATLTHEEDSSKESGARAALIKDKIHRIQQTHLVKHQHSYTSISKRAKALKQERTKKRQNLIAERRLILSESCSNEVVEDDSSKPTAEQGNSGIFKLYDIIEDKDDPKSHDHSKSSHKEENSTRIMCNGVPLIRVTGPPSASNDDYVYDYYIASKELDEKFITSPVSVESCEPEELVHPDDYGEPEEYYEEEDDSNDEGNWRNDYPDEDSDFEKNHDYYDDYDDSEEYIMTQTLKRFNIDEEKHGTAYTAYKVRVMKDLESDSDDFGDDE